MLTLGARERGPGWRCMFGSDQPMVGFRAMKLSNIPGRNVVSEDARSEDWVLWRV